MLAWTKVPGATSYVVYGSRCGKTIEMDKLANVKTTSFIQKELRKGIYYKYYVAAFRGRKKIATSTVVHITTTGGKYGNTASVTVPKKTITLKTGRTYLLNASVESKGTAQVHKPREISYESTNPKIAKREGNRYGEGNLLCVCICTERHRPESKSSREINTNAS